MTILRWILATALAISFLLLAVANWTPVPFRMPDGAIINIRLPVLLGLAFVAGWLPTWLIHLGSKATWKRKLAKTSAIESRPVTPVSTTPPTASPGSL